MIGVGWHWQFEKVHRVAMRQKRPPISEKIAEAIFLAQKNQQIFLALRRWEMQKG